MMRAGAAVALLLVVVGSGVAETRADTVAPDMPLQIRDKASLDQTLDHYVEGGGLPFIYARLEDAQGNLVYEHASVNRSLLPDVTIDGDTWIRIWSMSKFVTIAAALDLVEQGVIALDDPVTRYIPEFDTLRVAVGAKGEALTSLQYGAPACPVTTEPVRTPMTIRHLINHQAGFYYATTGWPCIDDALTAKTVARATDSDDLIARLAELPLIQQPGTAYFYGMNTTVLGLVLERATGSSLAELVESHVSVALSIDGLKYERPPGVELLPRFSAADGPVREAHAGELDIFGGEVPSYEPGHALYLGGEGMLATADGYADFLRMLLNGGSLNGARLLDAETVAEAVAPHTQLDNEWGHNGYNLWVNSGRLFDGSQGRGGLWIVGGYEGTHGWVDPELGIVGVMMTQIQHASAEANNRADRFREAVYDRLLDDRQGNEYKLYYLGGQSNMDGYGYNAKLPEHLRSSHADVKIYHGLSASDGNAKGGAGRWDGLQPGHGVGFLSNGYDNWLSDRFGPELSFGHRIVELNPDSKIAIVKYSRGGTPLHLGAQGYGTWNPDEPRANQYDFALRAIRESMADTDIDGDGKRDRLIPSGIIWMQGEADAFDSEEAAAAYGTNLERMMNLFRAALRVDDLPVVIGQITDSGQAEDGTVMDWADEVRSAQREYVEADACAALVTVTNELDYPENDAWHYTSDGYLRMGVAFAEAVADLEQRCAPTN